MTNNVLAIDPGLNGGIAWIKDGIVNACAMPTFSYQTSTRTKRKVSANVLADICREIKPVVVYCENVGAMRKGKKPQGAVSMFTFGMTLGVIHGVAGALNIPMELVLPQVWKNVVLTGTDKDKDAAIYFCDNHFPEVSLYKSSRSRKPHDGIADALCILHYAIDYESKSKNSVSHVKDTTGMAS